MLLVSIDYQLIWDAIKIVFAVANKILFNF